MCGAPPSWCDAHHIVHWSAGGATDLDNAVMLCVRCHHDVHRAGWDIHASAQDVWFTPPAEVDPKRRRRPGGRRLFDTYPLEPEPSVESGDPPELSPLSSPANCALAAPPPCLVYRLDGDERQALDPQELRAEKLTASAVERAIRDTVAVRGPHRVVRRAEERVRESSVHARVDLWTRVRRGYRATLPWTRCRTAGAHVGSARQVSRASP
ncbi:HNH endonuclease signature motif containing protein [Demequina sp. NBRC 110053]|uniref:HNH endonuclease signature motif containing protein n=1 Tax=Demequina sp. NBRC 110053 TaxID=1570342 RepID=UPI00352A7563